MRALIGCGSNLGERREWLARGVLKLAARDLAPVAVSSVWETAPLGCSSPAPFLNLVLEVESALDPRELLDRLLATEAELGRVRAEPNGPRTLDLDLLRMGELVRDEPGLRLPHPRMWQRRFVLAPLAELRPELRNPATGRTVVEEERALRAAQPGVVRVGRLALPEAALL